MELLPRWHYCADDCQVTLDLFSRLACRSIDWRTYRAEMLVQRMCVAVSRRGIRLDPDRVEALWQENAEIAARTVDGVNPRSPAQVAKRLREFGFTGTTTDAEALQKVADGGARLAGKNPPWREAAEFARAVLQVRAASKLLGYLKALRGKDRLYFTLDAGSTETFRLSSSADPVRGGCNAQTIPPVLRTALIPDPPHTQLLYADIRRAESWVVARLSGDTAYERLHEAADMHTEMAKLLWPDAGWTGNPEADDKLAREPGFIRGLSRRAAAKRCVHGLAYGATWRTIARTAGLPESEARSVHHRFFQLFPGIAEWQRRVAREAEAGVVRYPWGYVRRVERGSDPATVRSILASIPQAVVAWTTHLVAVRLWVAGAEILLHIHDAVLLQGPFPPNAFTVQWETLGWSPAWDFHYGRSWGEAD